ncbi:MAG TPA: right-handed parallel beta-helix repeat-containing protein, partial [Acidimicrobiia bacterium]|nr:right-handed parallel beta-helix repeat-containing protein [Acidimicrobiia bacterium]
AYRSAQPGDVVEVAAGSYGGQDVRKDASKPLGSARVVFRAVGTVTMAGLTSYANDVTYVDFRVPNNQITIRAGRNVTLENARAEKPYIWGPTSSSSTGDTLENVTIKGGDFGPHVSCGGGFQITRDGPPRNITVEGATFHDFSIDSSCPTAHLDCLHTFNGIIGLTIKNNRFYRCEHFGALINSASNVTVENNFFDGGIYGMKLRGDTDPSIEVFNNLTIRHNSGDHVSLGSSGSNTLNNALVEGNATIERVNCRPGVTYRNNIGQTGSPCGAGDLPTVRSLGFANPDAGDFHVPLSSPLVDRLTTGPATDYDHNARPQGPKYDIGADEVDQGS